MTVGGMVLSGIAAKIEHGAGTGEQDDIQTEFVELERQYGLLAEELKKL